MRKPALLLSMAALCTLLPSCALLDTARLSSAERQEQKRLAALRETATAEHELFRSLPNWKKNTYRNDTLLSAANTQNTAIRISLSEQRGFLLVDEAIAMDFPVATGKKSHPTPAGSYTILSKSEKYSSNLYGKIFDVEGNLLNSDADTRSDPIPEGGTFVGSNMPYWMRLTNSGVGMHVGYVPGRPASHGCIRLRTDTARRLFSLTRIGTPVTIAH